MTIHHLTVPAAFAPQGEKQQLRSLDPGNTFAATEFVLNAVHVFPYHRDKIEVVLQDEEALAAHEADNGVGKAFGRGKRC